MKPALQHIPQIEAANTTSQQDALVDLRFRTLLKPEQWQALPAATRRRFSKRVNDARTIVYTGKLVKMHLSRTGWWLAQFLRIIGAPLPINEDINVPSVVAVTEDMATGGQVWTRIYANNTRFPQVIHSAKRFSGPTGLEEYVGCGVAMALNVRVTDGVLIFENEGYYLRFGKRRLKLPRWMMPGDLTVTHKDMGDDDEAGHFEFSLELKHPWFGTLLKQVGHFCEEKKSVLNG